MPKPPHFVFVDLLTGAGLERTRNPFIWIVTPLSVHGSTPIKTIENSLTAELNLMMSDRGSISLLGEFASFSHERLKAGVPKLVCCPTKRPAGGLPSYTARTNPPPTPSFFPKSILPPLKSRNASLVSLLSLYWNTQNPFAVLALSDSHFRA